jgi:ribosomal protein S12 methylthiotransferase accessory factor YcaO
MATNLALDDSLIDEAVRVSGHRTKKAAVTHALTEYIERRKQRAILELFGKIDLVPAAEMKRQRNTAKGLKRRAKTA